MPTQKVLKTIKDVGQNEKEVAAVSGVYKNFSPRVIHRAYAWVQRQWVLKGLGKPQKNFHRPSENLLGGSLLVRREKWAEIKGFNEEIGWGAEETDFIQRLRKKKYKTFVTFKIRTRHLQKMGFLGFLKRAWVQNYNKSRFKIKSFNTHKRGRPFLSFLNQPHRVQALILIFASVSKVAYVCGWLMTFTKGKEI